MTYLGAYVRAGYLVPISPDENFETMLERFYEAAQAGDKTAYEILFQTPVTVAEEAIIRKNLGIRVDVSASSRYTLSPAYYPSPFGPDAYAYFRQQLEQKNIYAERLLADFGRKKFQNPKLIMR